jgi:hypothetical protein
MGLTRVQVKKITYDNFAKEYQNKFNSPIITFENYSKVMIGIQKENKNAKASLVLDKKVFSAEAITLVEKIRDLLNSSTDEKSLRINFKAAEKMVLLENRVSLNEKKLFSTKLDFLQEIAFEDSKSGRVKDVTAGPKCKWYQWGCVFYMSTAQVGVLFAIWAANDLLGNYELSMLVSEYGLNYIAECCGFCNCSCPDGCPNWL